MPNTKRSVSVTTDRMLEEPCEVTSLTHGSEAERRGRPLRLGNHLDILKQGVEMWNQWRKMHADIRPNLIEANLVGINLRGANLIDTSLSSANLIKANLAGADLFRADLSSANISKADLSGADLSRADLSGANLSGAILFEANFSRADLSEADLSGAILRRATLVETNLAGTNLTQCSIYGISVWNVQLKEAKQDNLIITSDDEPTITVDNLKVAQFIYLLLNNVEIREVIDTITSKVVLILGRFVPERKGILDALRVKLRNQNYTPVLFDFDKPVSRDITETVATLAHMARFVIADITEAKSIPQELSHIVPFLPSVPIVPLLQVSDHEYGMFEHFVSYPWVQPIYHYHNMDELLHSIQEHIIDPAEKKVRELAIEKAKRLERP